MSTLLDPTLRDRVAQGKLLGGGPSGSDFNAEACMNCGVCTAVCPMGIECLPRRLFRYVLLGMEQEVLGEVESIYSCLLCKMCEVNCPAGVRIAENVRQLRGFINRTAFGL